MDPTPSLVTRIRRLGPTSFLSWCLLVSAAVFLVFFLVVAAIFPPARSAVINVRTWHAEITFIGSSTAWDTTNAVLCGTEGACPPATRVAPCGDPSIDMPRAIRWSDGASARLTLRDDGMLVRLADTGEACLPDGTRLFFPTAAMLQNGAQAFNGALILGEAPRSGRRAYVIEGDFVFRQRSLASTLFRRQGNDVMLQGQLVPGDVIVPCRLRRVWKLWPTCDVTQGRPERTIAMRGFIAPSYNPAQPGLLVTATSELGEVGLFASGIGRASEKNDYTLIRPDWIDVVLASPTFLAFTIVLTYLASILQTLMSVGDRWERSRTADPSVAAEVEPDTSENADQGV